MYLCLYRSLARDRVTSYVICCRLRSLSGSIWHQQHLRSLTQTLLSGPTDPSSFFYLSLLPTHTLTLSFNITITLYNAVYHIKVLSLEPLSFFVFKHQLSDTLHKNYQARSSTSHNAEYFAGDLLTALNDPEAYVYLMNQNLSSADDAAEEVTPLLFSIVMY